MTKEQRKLYQEPEALQEIFKKLKGQKFKLSCGHRVTFGHFLGNDITIRNGANPQIICTDCSY